MAAFLLDIDGTLAVHGENRWIKENIRQVKELYEAGHQIILTTRRDGTFKPPSPYSIPETERLVRQLKEEYGVEAIVIYGVQSPRIVVNDEGAAAFDCKANQPWPFDLTNMRFKVETHAERAAVKALAENEGGAS